MMSKRRTFTAFVIALSLSLLFTWQLEKRSEKTSVALPAPVPMRPVLVATKNILPGESIQESSFSAQNWPITLTVPDAPKRASDVLGKTATEEIRVGEPLRSERLTGYGNPGGKDAKIPLGMRAVTLSTDDTARMGGLLEPGSIVDVLLNPTGEARPNSVSEVVLQGVRVLTLGEQTDPASNSKGNSSWSTLTLLVTPVEAAKLASATCRGKIVFTLRNRVDSSKGVAPSTAVSRTDFITHVDHPRAIKQDRTFTVELISGSKHLSQSFNEVTP